MANTKISIDLDGVLANFVYGAIKVANSLWPGKLDFKAEPTGWDFSNLLLKEELDKVFEEIRKTEKFWYKLKPYIDNIKALQTFIWTNKDVDVYFVTAREETIGKSVLEQTTDWLYAYQLWPNKLRSTVIPVKSGKIKHEVMRAVGIEYSIDDYPETVQLCNELPGHKAFLLDRPWNENFDVGPRVFSLSEYLNIIRAPKPPKPEKKVKKSKIKYKFSSEISTVPEDTVYFTGENGKPIPSYYTYSIGPNVYLDWLDNDIAKKAGHKKEFNDTTAQFNEYVFPDQLIVETQPEENENLQSDSTTA